MIHVFCSRGSDGARDLVEAIRLRGTLARRRRKGKAFLIADEDLVVCWGETFRKVAGVHARVLNSNPVFSKWEELAILRDKEVRTVPFALTKQGQDWLPRRSNHQGGSDLLHPGHADYYVQKVNVAREFRVHILDGKSIRVGMKVHRENFPNPHPWIRAYDAGWKLSYGDDCQNAIPRGVRDLAKKAVAALELDFGAVDIGVGTGGPWVFEVNKAPGLEGRTVEVYADQFVKLHGAQG